MVAGITVPVPDGRITVRDRGHGPPVLFVHGGTGTGDHDWADVAAALEGHRRVVTLDVRGHGASPNHGGSLDVRRFAADLLHVLRRLGIGRTDVVGFSMGANTVLELLSRRPDLVGRAILVGGSATGDPEWIRAIAASPEWPAALRDLRHEVDPSPDYWRRLRSELMEDWAATTEFPATRLARITCPVLVVNGARDPVQATTVAEHLAGALPDARLEVVKDAGHAVHHDRPRRFLALLDAFLTPPTTATPSTREVVVAC